MSGETKWTEGKWQADGFPDFGGVPPDVEFIWLYVAGVHNRLHVQEFDPTGFYLRAQNWNTKQDKDYKPPRWWWAPLAAVEPTANMKRVKSAVNSEYLKEHHRKLGH